MRSGNDDLVVNNRHYRILSIDRFNVVEAWAFYQVLDSQTGFRFRVAEFAGDKIFLETALRKAQRMAKLRIPGIPLIYDAHIDQEKLFVITDWAQGFTLREYLELRVEPARDDLTAVVEYGRRLCTLLSQLHPSFVHRGLRPENIILAGSRVLLTDLGFSFMPPGLEQEKLPYRAPEQTLKGGIEEISCRTDIYGFGLIFAEMLAGTAFGFPGRQEFECFQEAGRNRSLYTTWLEVPAELKEIVIHCSQSLPVNRPKNIEEVRRKLSEWLLFRKAEATASSTACMSAGRRHPISGTVAWPVSSKPEVPTCSACVRSAADLGRSLAESAATLTDSVKTPDIIQHTGLYKKKNMTPQIKRLAVKQAFWVLIISFLFMPPILWKELHPRQPATPPAAEMAAPPDPNLRLKAFEESTERLQEINTLIAEYRRAKVPGNLEKTAQNFRSIERRADALRRSMSGLVILETDQAEVLTTELEAVDSLQTAAEIFGDYLEGRRKTTARVDWVEEADARCRKTLELCAQAAAKLENMKIRR